MIPRILAAIAAAALLVTCGMLIERMTADTTALAPAVTVTREPWPTDLEDAFDRGFAAGQEYEEWFCAEGAVMLP